MTTTLAILDPNNIDFKPPRKFDQITNKIVILSDVINTDVVRLSLDVEIHSNEVDISLDSDSLFYRS